MFYVVMSMYPPYIAVLYCTSVRCMLQTAVDNGGKVFIHCSQGVSRSTTLLIAYLMWRSEQPYDEVFQQVKAARGVANPNIGFICQVCKSKITLPCFNNHNLVRHVQIQGGKLMSSCVQHTVLVSKHRSRHCQALHVRRSVAGCKIQMSSVLFISHVSLA